MAISSEDLNGKSKANEKGVNMEAGGSGEEGSAWGEHVGRETRT